MQELLLVGFDFGSLGHVTDDGNGASGRGDQATVPGRGELPGGLAELDRPTRWRLFLGADASPAPDEPGHVDLDGEWAAADAVVDELYEQRRRGGLARSPAKLSRWLGRLREAFPPEAVTLMQRDAIERYELRALLAEPEILDTLEPDIHLAASLLQLGKLLPDRARAAADRVVADIARRLTAQLEEPLLRAVRSALASPTLRTEGKPSRHTDWGRTLLANLRHYRPEVAAVVPERFVNRVPRGRGLRNVHILVDQSASMATSAIHAALAAAVLARVPALRVRLVAFDTEVADLTGLLADPVQTLFGVQLGGGTDVNRALRYESDFLTEPRRSLVVLISDLYEGGSRGGVARRVRDLVAGGTRVICLLALSDAGRPAYDKTLAAALAEVGATVFSTTPALFAEMMGAAIRGEDLSRFGADA